MRSNAPRTRNTTPPPSISFPSCPHHPCGAYRSTGPSPAEDGGSTNPTRASESPSSSGDPGEQGPEAQKNGSPEANRVHSTAAPAARITAAVRPGSPEGPPGPDSAAPTAHAAGTAADSERPARVAISSHRSIYSEGVAATTRVIFPAAERPASRRNPWRSSAGGTGKRRSSSIPTASRRSLSFIGGNVARARYTRSAGRTRAAPAPTSPLRATNSPRIPSISSKRAVSFAVLGSYHTGGTASDGPPIPRRTATIARRPPDGSIPIMVRNRFNRPPPEAPCRATRAS